MSRESQAGKESRTQRNTHNPRSGRREGKPSFSLNDKAASDDQEEVLLIPENKVGLVIGKKGWRRNDIKERSGVQTLVIKDCQVRIRGTDEQRTKAKTLIDRILSVRPGKCHFSYYWFIFVHPLSVFTSTSLPASLPASFLFVWLSVCLSVCLPVCRPLYLPVIYLLTVLLYCDYRSFGEEVLDLKLRCCQGQLSSFPMVTISSPALSCRWRRRPTSCQWKRSQLPMTTMQIEPLKLSHQIRRD